MRQSCNNEGTIPRYWKVRTTKLVRNPQWLKNFTKKRHEINAELGGARGDLPYLESYAFGLVRKDITVCESADFKKQELYLPIGDLGKGVNLTVHADVLMSWARKKKFTNPSLIIYKVNLSVLAFYTLRK